MCIQFKMLLYSHSPLTCWYTCFDHNFTLNSNYAAVENYGCHINLGRDDVWGREQGGGSEAERGRERCVNKRGLSYVIEVKYS